VTPSLALGRLFARLVTVLVVRSPRLWRVFRAPLERQFDGLASRWDEIRAPGHLAPLHAALAGVETGPRRALDLGTGTGAAALAVAQRFRGAEVIGVDLSARMVEEARLKLPADLASRVRFEVADSAALPFEDASFELATLANMIPFFDELARVLAPGGHAVFAFSDGPSTPIFVPESRLRAELSRRGFVQFASFSAGSGTALVATKDAGARKV
jgi:ubiquinone/menaquinone biosynthesis C-methylase UbiE